jgi:hypothetical protein
MEVYKGIAQVTAAMGRDGIGKNRKNTQQGYQFRGIDDIYNALSSQLAAAQLCIIPRIIERAVVERQSKNGGTLFYVTVKAEYDIVSAVDGSKHTASAYGEAMDSADKGTNKAMSAAYKYLAMQLFCIPTEGDNDADAMTHEVAPQEKAPEFDASKARAAIAALPDCTDADNTKAATLTERSDLMALYNEVRARQAVPQN